MAATQLQLETTGSSPQSGRGDHKLEPGTTSGRTLEAASGCTLEATSGRTSGGTTSGWLWQTQWPIPPRPSPQSCH